MAKNKKGVLWAYLDGLSNIENFTQEEYNNARKHYYNVVYKRNYRRKRKESHQTFNVTLDKVELRKIQRVANKIDKSITHTIKQLSLINAENGEVLPRPLILDTILKKIIDLEVYCIQTTKNQDIKIGDMNDILVQLTTLKHEVISLIQS